MSIISETCLIISSLGLLATATVLYLQSRYLYWIGKDLFDHYRELHEAIERINAGSVTEKERDGDATPDGTAGEAA